MQNAEDLNETDPQIAHRGIFFEMDHPVIGEAGSRAPRSTSRGIEPDNWRSAPLLGEDNEYVFSEILGVADDEFAELTPSRGDLMIGADGRPGLAVRRSARSSSWPTTRPASSPASCWPTWAPT